MKIFLYFFSVFFFSFSAIYAQQTMPSKPFKTETVPYNLYSFQSKCPKSWKRDRTRKALEDYFAIVKNYAIRDGKNVKFEHSVYAQLGFGKVTNPQQTLSMWMGNRLRSETLYKSMLKQDYRYSVYGYKQKQTSLGYKLHTLLGSLEYYNGLSGLMGKSCTIDNFNCQLKWVGGEQVWNMGCKLHGKNLKKEKVYVVTTLYLNGKPTGFYKVQPYQYTANTSQYFEINCPIPLSVLTKYPGASGGVFLAMFSVYYGRTLEVMDWRSKKFTLKTTWSYYSQYKNLAFSKVWSHNKKAYRVHYKARIKNHKGERVSLGYSIHYLNGKTIVKPGSKKINSNYADGTYEANWEFYEGALDKILKKKPLPLYVVLTMKNQQTGKLFSYDVLPIRYGKSSKTTMIAILLEGHSSFLLIGMAMGVSSNTFQLNSKSAQTLSQNMGSIGYNVGAMLTNGKFQPPLLQPQLARFLIRKGKYYYGISSYTSYSGRNVSSAKSIRWTFYSNQTCTIKSDGFVSSNSSDFNPYSPNADATGYVHGYSHSSRKQGPIIRRPFEIRGPQGGPYKIIVHLKGGGVSMHPFSLKDTGHWGPFTPDGVSIDGYN